MGGEQQLFMVILDAIKVLYANIEVLQTYCLWTLAAVGILVFLNLIMFGIALVKK